MRIILGLIFILMFGNTSGFGQIDKRPENLRVFDKKKINFGYYLGFNLVSYGIEYKQIPQKQIFIDPQLGFNVGLIGDYKIMEYLNLRFEPGMFVTQRDLNFPLDPLTSSPTDLVRQVRSTYIRFPLMVKLSTKRLRNVRPYITAGLSYSINLSGNENSIEDNRSGTFRVKSEMNAIEVGVGTEIYLPYFKFTVALRGILGFSDELVPDNPLAGNPSVWTDNLTKIKTQGFFLNFIFQ